MADGRLPRGQAVEDGAAGGVAERVEDEIEILFNHPVEHMGIPADVQPGGGIMAGLGPEPESRLAGRRSRMVAGRPDSGEAGDIAWPLTNRVS